MAEHLAVVEWVVVDGMGQVIEIWHSRAEAGTATVEAAVDVADVAGLEVTYRTALDHPLVAHHSRLVVHPAAREYRSVEGLVVEVVLHTHSLGWAAVCHTSLAADETSTGQEVHRSPSVP